MSWAMRFLFDDPAPVMMDGTGLQADSATLAKVRSRQDEVREAMGTRWMGHLRHTGFTTRAKLASDWEEALIENAARQSTSVVRFNRRK